VTTTAGAKKYTGVEEIVTKTAGSRWRSRISRKGKMISLGTYDTEKIAAAVWDVEARKLSHSYKYNFESLEAAQTIAARAIKGTKASKRVVPTKPTLTSTTPGYKQFSHNTLTAEDGGPQIMYRPATGGESVCCHQRRAYECMICQPALYKAKLKGHKEAMYFHSAKPADSAHNKRSREKEVCSSAILNHAIPGLCCPAARPLRRLIS
jgi:hypothetical protein